MSKVFIPQIPMVKGPGRLYVEKYDLTSARAWGEVVPLVRSGNIRTEELGGVHRAMLEVLDKQFTDEDFLLMMGDPTAQAMMVSIATQLTGTLRLLKWDRQNAAYYVQSFDVTY